MFITAIKTITAEDRTMTCMCYLLRKTVHFSLILIEEKHIKFATDRGNEYAQHSCM